MAKNWNVKDFASAVAAGGDTRKEAIFDAGRRFPLASNLVSAIMASSGSEYFLEFAGACPDWMTMRKLESVLKDGVNATAEEAEPETEAVEEAPKPEKKTRGRKKAVKEEVKEEKPAKKARKAKKEKVEEPAPETEEEEEEWEI